MYDKMWQKHLFPFDNAKLINKACSVGLGNDEAVSGFRPYFMLCRLGPQNWYWRERSGHGPGPWVEKSVGQLLEKRDYLNLTWKEKEKLNSHCGPGDDVVAKNEVSSSGHRVLRIMECLWPVLIFNSLVSSLSHPRILTCCIQYDWTLSLKLKSKGLKSLSICQQIWKTQQWLQDWKRSVFSP